VTLDLFFILASMASFLGIAGWYLRASYRKAVRETLRDENTKLHERLQGLT
jgi:hypothetical protein